MDSQQARLNNDKDTEAELQQTLEGARLVRQRQAAARFLWLKAAKAKAKSRKSERRKTKGLVVGSGLVTFVT